MRKAAYEILLILPFFLAWKLLIALGPYFVPGPKWRESAFVDPAHTFYVLLVSIFVFAAYVFTFEFAGIGALDICPECGEPVTKGAGKKCLKCSASILRKTQGIGCLFIIIVLPLMVQGLIYLFSLIRGLF